MSGVPQQLVCAIGSVLILGHYPAILAATACSPQHASSKVWIDTSCHTTSMVYDPSYVEPTLPSLR